MDGFDGLDQRITQPAVAYCGTYHLQTAGEWAGDTGFYSSDITAPLALAVGQSRIWTFFLWEDPASNVTLDLSWGWGGTQPAPALGEMNYTLDYARAAQGVAGGSTPVGTSVLLNRQQQGTWAFPVYKTTDGRTGYMFTLTATVVPEPSSLLALLAGMGGCGAILRRRLR